MRKDIHCGSRGREIPLQLNSSHFSNHQDSWHSQTVKLLIWKFFHLLFSFHKTSKFPKKFCPRHTPSPKGFFCFSLGFGFSPFSVNTFLPPGIEWLWLCRLVLVLPLFSWFTFVILSFNSSMLTPERRRWNKQITYISEEAFWHKHIIGTDQQPLITSFDSLKLSTSKSKMLNGSVTWPAINLCLYMSAASANKPPIGPSFYELTQIGPNLAHIFRILFLHPKYISSIIFTSTYHFTTPFNIS